MDYLDYWDVDDLTAFIESWAELEKKGKEKSSSTGHSYTTENLDQFKI